MPDSPGLIGAPLAALRPAPPPQQPQASARAAETDVPPEVRRVAEEFEAVFLTEMMAPMFESIDADGLGGGGSGERMFRPMLVEQYAQAISKSGGIGLADSVIREMMRFQAAASPPTPEAADGADR